MPMGGWPLGTAERLKEAVLRVVALWQCPEGCVLSNTWHRCWETIPSPYAQRSHFTLRGIQGSLSNAGL